MVVIDVPAEADGAHAQVVADTQRQSAICYLDSGDDGPETGE